jgi:hypothetical protein
MDALLRSRGVTVGGGPALHFFGAGTVAAANRVRSREMYEVGVSLFDHGSDIVGKVGPPFRQPLIRAGSAAFSAFDDNEVLLKSTS